MGDRGQKLHTKVYTLKEYNQTPHTITGFPPMFLMYGEIPDSPHNLNYPSLSEARKIATERTELAHERNRDKYNSQHQTPNFKVGDQILLQTFFHPDQGKLAPKYHGPFTILKIVSPCNVEIDRPVQSLNKLTDIVNVDKIIPYYNPTNFRVQADKLYNTQPNLPEAP
ncbi:uncharacterized protein LOC111619326 [Centruroides sculpturatus]|uniref:uncharacterized protein LOC111619326 n=1 Tax=Centruroides sculpturatus TaxID=218467 RepID=UPI000C6EE7B3|nr:uncharacterized protein LOC111619326 [Centruroides sculpturatus]